MLLWASDFGNSHSINRQKEELGVHIFPWHYVFLLFLLCYKKSLQLLPLTTLMTGLFGSTGKLSQILVNKGANLSRLCTWSLLNKGMELEELFHFFQAFVLLAYLFELLLLLLKVKWDSLGLYAGDLVSMTEMSIDSMAPGVESPLLWESHRESIRNLYIFNGCMFFWRKSYLLRKPALVVKLCISKLVLVTVSPRVGIELLGKFVVFLVIVISSNKLLMVLIHAES